MIVRRHRARSSSFRATGSAGVLRPLAGALLLGLLQSAPAQAGCMKDGPDGFYFEGNAALCPGQGGGQTYEQSHFAAIAISNSDISVFGYSWHWATRSEAERTALANCKAKDCKVQMWGQGECIAVAETPDSTYWGVGSGLYPGNAEADAIRECEGLAKSRCVVLAHPCSED